MRSVLRVSILLSWTIAMGACGGSSSGGGGRPASAGDGGAAGAEVPEGGTTATAGAGANAALGGEAGNATTAVAGAAQGEVAGADSATAGAGAVAGGGAEGGAAGASPEGGAPGASPEPGKLVPCDITAAVDPCTEGMCAGTPWGGYYCREACPATAASGDSCGSNGVCLEAGIPEQDEDPLACFELDDCDYMTSAECDTAAGESCVLIDFEPLRTACVPAGDGQVWDECEAQSGQECAAGLACLGSDLEDDRPGRCTPLCLPGEALPADCVQCIQLTAELGSCAECSVLDQDCAAGEHCYPVSEALGGVCVETGSSQAGEECSYDPAGSPASCAAGMLCLEQENPDGPDPLYCTEICDLSAPECELANHTCNDLGVFDTAFDTGQLALCLDVPVQLCSTERGIPCSGDGECIENEPGEAGVCVMRCDPTGGNDACEDNHACVPIAAGELFVDAFIRGNGLCGLGCEADADCNTGETCLHLDGLEQAGICGTSCDPAAATPCAAGERCVPTPEDAAAGACVEDLGLCDPSADEDPCGPFLACAPLTGSSTEGVCGHACYVQDPNACATNNDACIEKTGDQWHAGLCIGTPTPCDPVEQSGCEAGETCGVLAGSAIGGQAFTCETAGTVKQGGDCSGDEVRCVEGLLCLADVCEQPCAPAEDQCATGTCEDVSERYYLTAQTIGICGTG